MSASIREQVVYEDDVRDDVRSQLATLDGVLVWVNPIHDGRNRAKLDVLLHEVAAQGVWVSAHPDVIAKEVLDRTCKMSWGCDTALYRTAEAMRAELPARIAAGPRVIKRIHFAPKQRAQRNFGSTQGQKATRRHSFRFSGEFATSWAQSMKSCATGLSARLFSVTIPFGTPALGR